MEVESYLVGLCPFFWAHVPLSIQHVQSMKLVNGLHCLLLHNNRSNGTFVAAVPLSKCRLVGTIVAIDRRGGPGGGEATIYVIDDGTGLLDCLHWNGGNGDGLDLGSQDILPDLLGHERQSGSTDTTGALCVGQLVLVHGQIDCACVILEDESHMYTSSPTNTGATESRDSWATSSSSSSFQNLNGPLEIRSCLREIRVSLIQPVGHHCIGIQRGGLLENAEVQHWSDVQDFYHQLWQSTIGNVDPVQCSSAFAPTNKTYLNTNKILDLLGPTIRNKIQDLGHVPSTGSKDAERDDGENEMNDVVGSAPFSWHLFGPRCKCHDLTYKSDLLYCHCLATPLVLPSLNCSRTHPNGLGQDDPQFIYRDALLAKLLQMEQEHQTRTKPTSLSGWELDPLRFQYSSVVEDPKLVQLAQEQYQNACNLQTSVASAVANIPRDVAFPRASSLFALNTFRALRSDGIVYLLDQESDTYVLLSREGAIEPYLRQTILNHPSSADHSTCLAMQRKRERRKKNPPIYWSSIPLARIQHVKRLLLWKEQQRQQSTRTQPDVNMGDL